jgi:hypothetical protein
MKQNLFKAVTAIAGIYHIALALVGLFLSAEMAGHVSRLALGVVLKPDSQLLLVTRFTAAYMLAFGIMLLVVAMNPRKYRIFALAAVALFGIRFLNRVFLFNLISTTFEMSSTRNVIGTAVIFIFLALIFITMPKKTESAEV